MHQAEEEDFSSDRDGNNQRHDHLEVLGDGPANHFITDSNAIVAESSREKQSRPHDEVGDNDNTIEVTDNTTLSRLTAARPKSSSNTNTNKRARTSKRVNSSNRRLCSLGTCGKQAVTPTTFCVSHGGGVRCSAQGCTKTACKPTAFCVAHGGGRRCTSQGCVASAQGKTTRCIKHG